MTKIRKISSPDYTTGNSLFLHEYEWENIVFLWSIFVKKLVVGYYRPILCEFLFRKYLNQIQKLTLTGLEHEFVTSSLFIFDESGSFSLFIIPVLHSEYLNILSKHKTTTPLWFIFGPLNEESYEFIFTIQESQMMIIICSLEKYVDSEF